MLVLGLPRGAWAQVTGFVESVGFDNHYRPNAWTPLLVNLTSEATDAQDLQIQIVQQDLDKDVVTYTRDITLNGGTQQKFWAFFIPQPTDKGLPDQSMDELQKVLRVYLATRPDANGRTRQLKQLPVRITLNNLDPTDDNAPRGQKLVLWITDGSSRPAGLDYANTIGTMEDVTPVQLHPRDLPENVLAYDAVDTILWLSGNSDELDEAGAHRKEALEEFVRRGGQLVVCQGQSLHHTDALADLLPVKVRDLSLAERSKLDPLPDWSVSRGIAADPSPIWRRLEAIKQFQTGRATATDDAMVEDWIDWKGDGSDLTPFLARRPLGLGSVTWVAQDLGDPMLAQITPGWPMIWDHIFGWNNSTRVNVVDQKVIDVYRPADYNYIEKDVAEPLFAGTDQEGRGAGLLGLAICFFIVYWVAAGPGAYFFLANRNRKELSWFIFGLSTLLATAATMLLVKLVLRGDPVLKHTSVARTALADHSHVLSRIGLYIPRDGIQTIELNQTADDAQSALSALIANPQHLQNTEFPASQDYTVPVEAPDEPVAIRVPFRSTLKKIEARWVGDQQGGIVGSPQLVPSAGSGKGYIAGTLVNDSGYDLSNVYFFFRHPAGAKPTNWVLFVPYWKSQDPLDLGHAFSAAPTLQRVRAAGQVDWNKQTARDWIEGDWSNYWYSFIDGMGSGDPNGADFRADMPMLAAFDLLPPPVNNDQEKAFGMIRRGGRNMNLSGAILAGRLGILAESATPLPCPMTVDGRKMDGSGTTIFEFVLPLDRSALQPATNAVKG